MDSCESFVDASCVEPGVVDLGDSDMAYSQQPTRQQPGQFWKLRLPWLEFKIRL